MAEITRKIGSGQTFVTHQGAFDQLVIDCSGDMSAYGIQHMHTEIGGTNDVFFETVDAYTGLSNMGASDYVSWENQNSFIRNGVAIPEYGTVIKSTTGIPLRTCGYSRVDGYTLISYSTGGSANALRGLGGNFIFKNLFLIAIADADDGSAEGVWTRNCETSVMANVCVCLTVGRVRSNGVYAQASSGSHTLKAYHCTFMNMWGEHEYSSAVYCQATAGNAQVVNSYNCIAEDMLHSGLCWAKIGSGGTETINNYNCISGDGSADDYGGSGNMINKALWKDLFISKSQPTIRDSSSDAYNANYDLSSDPNKAHFLTDIHGNARTLTTNGCSIGCSEFQNIGLPDTPSEVELVRATVEDDSINVEIE